MCWKVINWVIKTRAPYFKACEGFGKRIYWLVKTHSKVEVCEGGWKVIYWLDFG